MPEKSFRPTARAFGHCPGKRRRSSGQGWTARQLMPVSPPTYRPAFLPTKGERDRQYNKVSRNKESTRFYHSKAWLLLRDVKLCNSPYCETCLLGGVHTPASHVHHKEEVSTHPHMALDEDNLMSLCLPCHSSVHACQ